jgi:hypothetical protein
MEYFKRKIRHSRLAKVGVFSVFLIKMEQKEWKDFLKNGNPKSFDIPKEELEEGLNAYMNLPEEYKENIALALNFQKFDNEFREKWNMPKIYDEHYGAVAGNLALMFEDIKKGNEPDEDIKNFLERYYYYPLRFSDKK